LQRTQQEKTQGVLITTSDQTLNVFFTSWLHDTAQHAVREKTYIRYCQLIELHVLPTLGKIKLQKLAPQHLQRLYNQKRAEGYAPQTVQHIHRLLHRVLKDAVRWNLIPRNIGDLVDVPRVPKQEMQVLTPEQARQFLDASRDDPLEALYVLALTAGMREGELLALQWKDLDWTYGTVQVRRTIARLPRKGFVVSEPKTAKSKRSIALAPMTLEALKRHRLHQHEQRLAAGPAWEEHQWIFCNAVGRPLEVSNMIRRSFRPLLEKAGLPQMRFHDLRHSCATLLLSMGVHPKIVQERLGHSQIMVTLDTYSHVLPSLQEEAAQRLDQLLSPRTPASERIERG
ncbi:MAG: site-specific integrase, partial [Chloroflexota bacterium]|nr:site-specific integrase [Chloroflexota bacterium]